MNINPIYQPFFDTEKRYVILYGSAGSGKSHVAAQKLLLRALSEPGHRIPAFRKVKDTVRRSTFQRFKDILSAEAGLKRVVRPYETTMDIKLAQSIIWNLGLDDADKIKSIVDPTAAWIEEADQLNWTADLDDDFTQVDLRLRGPSPSYKQIILTFNPTPRARLIFERFGFDEADVPEHGYLETDDVFVMHSTFADNLFVGEEYVIPFRRMGEAYRTVYEYGHLADTTAPDQLIKPEHVKAAFERDPETTRTLDGGRGGLGVDVARFGNDDTVLQFFQGRHLYETAAFHGQDIARTARMVMAALADRNIGADRCAVDADGLGAGVVDLCIEEGWDVVEIQSGSSAVEVDDWDTRMQFVNLRSQMWFWASKQLEAGMVSLGVEGVAKTKLREDLLSPRYRVEKKREFMTVSVEPKDGRSKGWGIKQRLGRSTDYGDPFVYALFAEQLHVQPSMGYHSLAD